MLYFEIQLKRLKYQIQGLIIIQSGFDSTPYTLRNGYELVAVCYLLSELFYILQNAQKHIKITAFFLKKKN
jgi:hypothetical protein